MMAKSILGTSLVILVMLSACYNDKQAVLYPSNSCDTANVTYSAVIQPLLLNQCASAGCHGGTTNAAGLNLESYAGCASIANNGKLMGTIQHLSGYSPMPKGAAKMSDCDIAKINSWVRQGAPNN